MAWPGATAIFAALGGGGGGGGMLFFGGNAGNPGQSPELTGIQISPANPTIVKGTSTSLTALALYSDGSSRDVTNDTTWSSLNPGVASVTITGAVAGQSAGDAGITIEYQSYTDQTTVTVTPATLTSLQITPATATLALGTQRQFTATGIFSDGSNQDLSSTVSWSSNGKITLDGTGRGTATATGNDTITATVTVGAITRTATATVTITSATVTGISISPTNPSLPWGRTQQLSVQAQFSDGSSQDVTDQAAYSSDSPAVIEINSGGTVGLAKALTDTGSSLITAQYSGRQASTTITATAAILTEIQIAPTDPSIAKGRYRQFTATGVYSNGSSSDITSEVIWSSDSTSVSTIENGAGAGRAKGVSVGTAEITASKLGVESTTTLTVTAAELESIGVTSSDGAYTVHKGLGKQFHATGHYSDSSTLDITTQVTWSSSNASTIAAISNADGSRGYAASYPRGQGATGTTSITATLGAVTSAGATLTVTAAQLTAVQVTAVSYSVAAGFTRQFAATAIFSDGTENVTEAATWSSLNTAVATVSDSAGSKGLATAVAPGTVSIRASYSSELGSATLTVTSAVITSIEVSPATSTVARGLTKTFTATAVYSNGTTATLSSGVGWTSSNTGRATIAGSGTGTATGVSEGAVTITASYDHDNDAGTPALTAQASLTVTEAILTSISVSPTTPSVPRGQSQAFTATGNYSDSSTLDITDSVVWTSSNTAVATISNVDGSRGTASTLATGATTITASLDAVMGTSNLTVTSAVVTSITVSPATRTIARGLTQQYQAIGTYSDGSTADITSLVTWSSLNVSVATVSNVSGSEGLASTIAIGTATIRAQYNAITKDSTLTVTAASLVSISVTPAGAQINQGTTQQFTATGTYTDGSTSNMTTMVVWSSSAASVATISNTAGTKGLATAVATGSTNETTTITAAYDPGTGPISGQTNLTVLADSTAPTVVSAASLGSSDCSVYGYSDCVRVTFSEAVQAGAATASYYKIVDSVSGSCEAGTNFSNSTETTDFSITAATSVNATTVVLGLSAGTQYKNYTLIASSDIVDTAGNPVGCPNEDAFIGADTVRPYLLTVTNPGGTTIVARFSEPMRNGTGTNADADRTSSYTLANLASSGCTTTPTIQSVSRINDSTYQLTLDSSICGTQHRLTVASSVTDPSGNLITDPKQLTFIGNEQLRIIGAEAVTSRTVRVTFNKAILPASADCTGNAACSTIWKFNPNGLGTIDSAVTGSGTAQDTVLITHSAEQIGITYSVIGANGLSGDQFDNAVSIRDSDNAENLQPQPKDRANFVGLGAERNLFSDGYYYYDPFVDGTTFNYTFTYANRVYLAPNELNTAAFRFDANGQNSVLVSFAFNAGTCSATVGFGHGVSPVCANGNSGPNGERGIVGFTSAIVTLSGINYEILLVGPIKDGVTKGYFTQDTDSELDWKEFGFSVTGGNNTKSIQTLYAVDNHVYLGFSSNHGTQAPIVSHHTATQSGGLVSIGSGSDMTIRSVASLGKNAGGSSNPAASSAIVGIDSMLKYSGALYMANNGGIRYSTDFSGFTSSATATPSSGWTGVTLQLNSLEKIRPGQKGIPRLIEYNGRLYMARNVSTASSASATDGTASTPSRGELWKCDPGADNRCDPADWTRIISGTESDLPTKNAISLLQDNGSGRLYVGFDDLDATSSGIRVFRIASANPAPTSGTMASASWQQTGGSGFGTASMRYIMSSTTIPYLTGNYIYITVGDNLNAVKVYRQFD